MAKIRQLPFGYRIQQGIIAVDENEAAVVRSAYSAYISGESFATIAKQLSESGVRYHPHTDVWNKNMVKRMIENAKYIGDGGYPMIVDHDTFALAESMRTKRSIQITRKTKEENPPCVTPPRKPQGKPISSLAIVRLEKEIEHAIQAPNLDTERIKRMIFDCALMRYKN